MASAASGDGEGASADDTVLPFSTVKSRALGRLVRLGAVVDQILSQHNYPDPVSEVVGEAIAMTAMLGTTLKIDGELIVQTRTDGPLGMLVVNYATPGRIRAHASFDAERVAEFRQGNEQNKGALIGSGYMALTVDPGKGMERYQGVVALEGKGLASAALAYFKQSEQLPSFVRLAVARHRSRSSDGQARDWQWRAGGILVQHVSPVGGAQHEDDVEDFLLGEDDDNWRRVSYLAETVEHHEMLDPLLPPERLLYRLFHEEGVRAGEPRQLEVFCRCSQERVENLIRSFKPEEIEELRDDDGNIVVTCEFCSSSYRCSSVGT